MKAILTVAAGALALAATNSTLRADTFGSGTNTFTIDFVNIGNPGNGVDAFESGFGAVAYQFHMGVFEISGDQIAKATTSGLTSLVSTFTTGAKPAVNISWYEAAAFVNWLNESTGHHRAYDIDENLTTFQSWSSAEAWQIGGENLYRHKDAHYFLPSEDEWCKAAFHKNDGITANYWKYATGSDGAPLVATSGVAPGTAVYDIQGVPNGFADVDLAGGLSPYGTMGQNGNVWEWQEGLLSLSLPASRAIRGGYWGSTGADLRSSKRTIQNPGQFNSNIGFRVASVPEPSTSLLAAIGIGCALLSVSRKCRRTHLKGPE